MPDLMVGNVSHVRSYVGHSIDLEPEMLHNSIFCDSQVPTNIVHLCERTDLIHFRQEGIKRSGGSADQNGNARMIHMHYMSHTDPRFDEVSESRSRCEFSLYLDCDKLLEQSVAPRERTSIGLPMAWCWLTIRSTLTLL